MKSLSSSVVCVVALFLALPGCGQGQFPVKPAKGKVVAGGQPVTFGSVTFTPIGTSGDLETGKPASGAVGPDGTFVLSTFDRFDGAIVGKHSVQYSGAEAEESEEEEEGDEEESSEEVTRVAEKKPQAKSQQKPQYVQKEKITVEVTASGPNDFTIELQPAGK